MVDVWLVPGELCGAWGECVCAPLLGRFRFRECKCTATVHSAQVQVQVQAHRSQPAARRVQEGAWVLHDLALRVPCSPRRRKPVNHRRGALRRAACGDSALCPASPVFVFCEVGLGPHSQDHGADDSTGTEAGPWGWGQHGAPGARGPQTTAAEPGINHGPRASACVSLGLGLLGLWPLCLCNLPCFYFGIVDLKSNS